MTAHLKDLTSGEYRSVAHGVLKGTKGVAEVTIRGADFIKQMASGDTYTVRAIPVLAGTIVTDVYAVVTTAEGVAVTALIGDGDDPNGYIASLDLNATGMTRGAGALIENSGTPVGKYYSADDTIDLMVDTGSTALINSFVVKLFVEYILA